VSVPRPDAETLATRLRQARIVAEAADGDHLRLSTHFFTTQDDVDAVLDAL
jgi:selenocysteine lyase/cysteine desulfurase